MKGKLVKAEHDLSYFRARGNKVTIPKGSVGVVTANVQRVGHNPLVEVTWFMTDYGSKWVVLESLEIIETAKPLRGRPFKEKVDVQEG